MSETSISHHKESHYPQDKFCLYLPGVRSTNRSIQGIRSALQGKFGDQFMAVDSLISSSGFIRPEKYIALAELLVEKYQSKKELVIMVHSFGTVEFCEVLKQMEQTYPELLTPESDFMQKLHLVMIAPFGLLEGKNRRGLYLSRYIDSKKYLGIDSAALIPLAGIDQQDFNTALRFAYPERSPYFEGNTQVNSEKTQYYSVQAQLPQKRAKRLSQIDREICAAVQVKDWMTFQKKMIERGICLHREIAAATCEGVYFSDYKEDGDNPLDRVEKGIGVALLGMKNGMKMFIDALAGGPFTVISKLQNGGADIRFLIPEFDTFITPKEAEHFVGEKKTGFMPTSVILGGFTHSNFVHQAHILIEGLTALGL